MKKVYIGFILLLSVLLFSCQTSTSVDRVSSEDVPDLTGEWSDRDVQIVCNSFIFECLESPVLTKFRVNTGKNPLIKVGMFRNLSDEHIDTSIITSKLRTAIINSGEADFVADGKFITNLREERQDQQSWANWETQKELANEDAADFMLQGSVKSIVQKDGNKTVRTYHVNAELVDIESGRIVWAGENDEIKKVITRPNYRW